MKHQPEFLGNFHRFKLDSHTCNVLGEQVTHWFVWDAEEIDEEVNLPARVVQKDTREEAIDTLKRLYPEAFVPLDY